MVSITTYYEMYQMNPEKARAKLLEIWQKTGSMRETARIFSCSVSTVSKWSKRDNLKDKSRSPNKPKRKLTAEIIELIKKERQKTNLGRRRLARHIKDEYFITIPEGTIAYWLRKLNLSRPCKQRARYKGISYYNWPELKPLQHWQVDTKDIRDSKTLPKPVYRHFVSSKLPRYQFTAIDVKTRLKFISYAYSNNRTNGIAFMKLLINWLRACGYKNTVYIQTDWGNEYGGHSIRTWKLMQKDIFSPRNAFLLKIRKRKWIDNAFVERTHRTDDEEFYIPKLPFISNLDDLLKYAWGWITFFNTKRPHYGKGINGRTPAQLLRNLAPYVDERICFLPPVILDFVSSSKLFLFEESQRQFASYRGVRDVVDTYFPVNGPGHRYHGIGIKRFRKIIKIAGAPKFKKEEHRLWKYLTKKCIK